MLKRAVDLTFATSLLMLALPVLAVCAVLIRWESPGPVLFRQKRMGRGFRPFTLFKLRTMTDGVRGLPYTVGGDPRVTRAGRWLRRTKLDEIPQLINIVRGDMSVVGPRPVVPEIAFEFRGEYESLLKVRPGLTDPASLKYCRESELLAIVPDPMAYFEGVVAPEKIRLSREYIVRANALSDLGLMLRTAVAVLDASANPREDIPSAGMRPAHVFAEVGAQSPWMVNAMPAPDFGKRPVQRANGVMAHRSAVGEDALQKNAAARLQA